MQKVKPVVYMASPYTHGDAAINTHFQCQMFHSMLDDGIVIPLTPHLLTFSSIFQPRSWDEWLEYDKGLLRVVDGILRLNAEYAPLGYKITESKGADEECAYMIGQNKPVFYNKQDLYEWAVTFNG